MRRLFAPLVLMVVLGPLGWSQTARGDHLDPVPMATPACCQAGSEPAAGLDPATMAPPPSPHESARARVGEPLIRHFNPHWWGCGTDQYNPGCDNLKDECRFLFGSCREFYGQPCLKQWHPFVESHHGAHP